MEDIILDPELMKRFIYGIDNRIFRIKGINTEWRLSYDEPSNDQSIIIDLIDEINRNAVCRVYVLNDKERLSFTIWKAYPNLKRCATIGVLYSSAVPDRIFNDVQNIIREYFRNKRDG